MGLSNDFKDFLESPESKKPAFQVREDWREWQYEQAVLNGDIYADQNPNTELVNDWAEPDFGEEEFENEEDLPIISKLSKKSTEKNKEQL